jgi:iron complex transport system permease protein
MTEYTPMIRARLLFVILLLLAVVSMLFALTSGSVAISWEALWQSLGGDHDGIANTIVWELRLPRAGTAFVVGGLLALAGALMQVLLRNPLADPYVLGISGGAAVMALSSMMLGLGLAWVNGGALLGALLSMLLVFGLAHGRGLWTPARLLLTGVVVAAGWSAMISFLLAISPERNLRGMLFWLMGDLGHAAAGVGAWTLLIAGLVIAFSMARSLNLLVRGESQAAVLGVAVRPVRTGLYLLASLLTATAVTLAGSIGFVGLIVPHMLRLLAGGDHRILLPASVLLGGSLLVFADTLSRSLLAPRQLPVGVVMALIGVPVFLWLLYRSASLSTSRGAT